MITGCCAGSGRRLSGVGCFAGSRLTSLGCAGLNALGHEEVAGFGDVCEFGRGAYVGFEFSLRGATPLEMGLAQVKFGHGRCQTKVSTATGSLHRGPGGKGKGEEGRDENNKPHLLRTSPICVQGVGGLWVVAITRGERHATLVRDGATSSKRVPSPNPFHPARSRLLQNRALESLSYGTMCLKAAETQPRSKLVIDAVKC